MMKKRGVQLALLVALSVLTLFIAKQTRQRGLNEALYYASYGERMNLEKMKQLLDKGADPNGRLSKHGRRTSENESPLHAAIGSTVGGTHEVCGNDQRILRGVRLLVERGADINAQDVTGATPLMAAAEWGEPAVVDYLLQRGARIDLRDRQDRTALDYSQINNCGDVSRQITRQLRKAGAKH